MKIFLILLKKPTTDVIKTAPEKATQKTAEATYDLFGDNVDDEITNTSKKFFRENLQNL